jgi:hypothetical protein
MRRPLLLLLLPALIAGCGGHKHQETANDVAQRLVHAESVSLGNPASVSCHRASPKWWRCDVTQAPRPNSLGVSSEEVLVRAR